jgi:drug/metabolite transporter (DMT)-like permease
VFYGLYFVMIRRARNRAPASALMLWTTASGAPVLLGIALLLHEPVVPAGSAGWWACVGLGVMHVAGQGAIAWALGRVQATTASVVMLLQPIVASLLGWTLFGEAIGPLQALCAVVVLAGVILTQLAARPGEAQAVAGHENGLGEVPEPANLKA